jgi:glutamyl-tRNA reductase
LSKLPASEREAVDACTRAIVNKILHDPILLMKTEEVKEGAPKYSEILKKLFRLEPED